MREGRSPPIARLHASRFTHSLPPLQPPRVLFSSAACQKFPWRRLSATATGCCARPGCRITSGRPTACRSRIAGAVTRIAAAVDASLATVRLAAAAKADLLLVHHGLFWAPAHPWTGKRHELIRCLHRAQPRGLQLASAAGCPPPPGQQRSALRRARLEEAAPVLLRPRPVLRLSGPGEHLARGPGQAPAARHGGEAAGDSRRSADLPPHRRRERRGGRWI